MANRNKDPIYTLTAYDDAFRTMESECNDILIPFVNYMFGENYSMDDVVIRMRNEHFISQPGRKRRKRITDSYFKIVHDGISKDYHLECESSLYDKTILVRIFEYDSQIALDSGYSIYDDNSPVSDISRLNICFPNSGLVELRSNSNTPDSATITLNTPGGSVSYNIPIIRVNDFTIEKIFDNKLYLLIPFYIFKHEDELNDINSNEDKTDDLVKTYDKIMDLLHIENQNGRLSTQSLNVIIQLTESVLHKLTMKYESVQKKVGDLMGGKVIMLPEIVAMRKAREQVYKEVEDERKENEKYRRESEKYHRESQAEIKALREEISELKAKLAMS